MQVICDSLAGSAASYRIQCEILLPLRSRSPWFGQIEIVPYKEGFETCPFDFVRDTDKKMKTNLYVLT